MNFLDKNGTIKMYIPIHPCESEAAGEAASSMVSQWYLFFLSLEHVPSRPIAEPWLGIHGAKPLEPHKNLHPTVPKTESKIDPK